MIFNDHEVYLKWNNFRGPFFREIWPCAKNETNLNLSHANSNPRELFFTRKLIHLRYLEFPFRFFKCYLMSFLSLVRFTYFLRFQFCVMIIEMGLFQTQIINFGGLKESRFDSVAKVVLMLIMMIIILIITFFILLIYYLVVFISITVFFLFFLSSTFLQYFYSFVHCFILLF